MPVEIAKFRGEFPGLVHNGDSAECAVLDDLALDDIDDRGSIIMVVRGHDAVGTNGQSARAQQQITDPAPTFQRHFAQRLAL